MISMNVANDYDYDYDDCDEHDGDDVLHLQSVVREQDHSRVVFFAVFTAIVGGGAVVAVQGSCGGVWSRCRGRAGSRRGGRRTGVAVWAQAIIGFVTWFNLNCLYHRGSNLDCSPV